MSGVRVSELVNLSINDIDFTARELHVREGKGKVATFTETPVRVPVSDSWEAVFVLASVS